jgi:hypothetical protein
VSAELTAAPLRGTPQAGGRSLLRLLAPLALFLVLFAGVMTVRTALQRQAAAQAVALEHSATMPSNAAIEDRWGIRVTAVKVLADGGMVELRYLVLDPAKGARIHSGDVKDLPIIRADDTGKEVRSYSLMFHLHANHIPTEVDGRNYSIIFGNAGGAIHTGGTVTLVLADGLRLEHVPVT